MKYPQKRASQHSQVSPDHARQSPLPALHGNGPARRSYNGLHLPYYGIGGTLFLRHIRSVALYEQAVAFPTDDAVQQVLPLVLEQHYIHGAQLLCRTRTEHHLVFSVTDEREHGNSLQAELHRTAIGYLRFHPGKKQVIGYLHHGRIRFGKTNGLLQHRASKPNDRTEQRKAIG